MTDKEFIVNFLNKNFEVKGDRSGFLFYDKKLKTAAMDQSTFINIFKTIFPEYITDENETPLIICKEWFGEEAHKFAKEIDIYLSDVTIELGRRDWIIKKPDGTVVTLSGLQERFEGVYTPQFITNYYGEWYSSEVAIISERMMSEGYI